MELKTCSSGDRWFIAHSMASSVFCPRFLSVFCPRFLYTSYSSRMQMRFKFAVRSFDKRHCNRPILFVTSKMEHYRICGCSGQVKSSSEGMEFETCNVIKNTCTGSTNKTSKSIFSQTKGRRVKNL